MSNLWLLFKEYMGYTWKLIMKNLFIIFGNYLTTDPKPWTFFPTQVNVRGILCDDIRTFRVNLPYNEMKISCLVFKHL